MLKNSNPFSLCLPRTNNQIKNPGAWGRKSHFAGTLFMLIFNQTFRYEKAAGGMVSYGFALQQLL